MRADRLVEPFSSSQNADPICCRRRGQNKRRPGLTRDHHVVLRRRCAWPDIDRRRRDVEISIIAGSASLDPQYWALPIQDNQLFVPSFLVVPFEHIVATATGKDLAQSCSARMGATTRLATPLTTENYVPSGHLILIWRHMNSRILVPNSILSPSDTLLSFA